MERISSGKSRKGQFQPWGAFWQKGGRRIITKKERHITFWRETSYFPQKKKHVKNQQLQIFHSWRFSAWSSPLSFGTTFPFGVHPAAQDFTTGSKGLLQHPHRSRPRLKGWETEGSNGGETIVKPRNNDVMFHWTVRFMLVQNARKMTHLLCKQVWGLEACFLRSGRDQKYDLPATCGVCIRHNPSSESNMDGTGVARQIHLQG